MSQLELALKKARALEAAAHGKAPDRIDAESRVATWAFKSAWDFDSTTEPQAPRVVSPPAPADARQKVRRTEPAARFRHFNPDFREKLVVGDQALPELREQFRKIAATLYTLQHEHQRNVVMIVSAEPGEGKTLTATNLALTLSESYRSRVLLVDADLRRPSLHKLFDIPNTVGLKEGLTPGGDSTFTTITVSPHLEVLTAGSSNVDPMSALTSDLLRIKLAEAAIAFDWVVLDTPPVELLPDARILAGLADVAILVVEAAVTKCELARRAIEAIGRERVVGAVLNQLPNTLGRTRYQGYDYADDQHSPTV